MATKKGGAPGPRVIIKLPLGAEDSSKDKAKKDKNYFVKMKKSVAAIFGWKAETTPPTFDMTPGKGGDGTSTKATWSKHTRYRKVGTGDAKYTIKFIQEVDAKSGEKSKKLETVTIGVPRWMNTKDVVEMLLKSNQKSNIQSIVTPNGHRIFIAADK